MRNTRHNILLAAAMIAAVGTGSLVGNVTTADPNPHRPRPPKRSTTLQREIAAHNEAVEARKAAKKARKLQKD